MYSCILLTSDRNIIRADMSANASLLCVCAVRPRPPVRYVIRVECNFFAVPSAALGHCTRTMKRNPLLIGWPAVERNSLATTHTIHNRAYWPGFFGMFRIMSISRSPEGFCVIQTRSHARAQLIQTRSLTSSGESTYAHIRRKEIASVTGQLALANR